jgi:hypothetical protein
MPDYSADASAQANDLSIGNKTGFFYGNLCKKYF